MDALYDNLNNTRFDATTRLKISYGILKGASRYKLFEPCVRQYLYKHVRSKFLIIDAKNWDQVLMLPIAKFEKASMSTVYRDSLSKISR